MIYRLYYLHLLNRPDNKRSFCFVGKTKVVEHKKERRFGLCFADNTYSFLCYPFTRFGPRVHAHTVRVSTLNVRIRTCYTAARRVRNIKQTVVRATGNCIEMQWKQLGVKIFSAGPPYVSCDTICPFLFFDRCREIREKNTKTIHTQSLSSPTPSRRSRDVGDTSIALYTAK